MEKKINKAELAKSLVSRRPIIFDIGCNNCEDSIELYHELKVIGSAPRFYCFDADERACEEAAFKTSGKPFQVYKHAVGKENAIVDFYQSDSKERAESKGKTEWTASGSLLKPKEHLNLFPDVQFNNVSKVNMVTLDNLYFKHVNPFMIDLIWADVNGGEEGLILGGLQALKTKTMYLYIEFAEKELYEGQIKQVDILNLLPEFELLGVYGFLGNFGNLLLKNKTL